MCEAVRECRYDQRFESKFKLVHRTGDQFKSQVQINLYPLTYF